MAQGVRGHLALMSQRVPIAEASLDNNLSQKRKEQIRQVLSIRQFAHETLKLPKNNSYTSYVELNKEAVSWNVIATPKYSISPIKTCFPIAGCVSYLLYFSKERAEHEAEKHRKQGHDVHIIASPAYSTRGWFDDPILSTMFKGDISVIAQLVFHELAHQKLYRKNDSAFNEAFASTIGEQGTKRWLKKYHPDKQKPYAEYLQKKWQFFKLLLSSRKELGALYRTKKPNNEMEKSKQNIIKRLRTRYAQLKKEWRGDGRYDAWFSKHPINNAKLAVIGVYYKRVPEFNQQLKVLNYDFEKFYDYYESEKDVKE